MVNFFKRFVNWVVFGVPVHNVKAEVLVAPSNNVLEGKKILITGGGRGLGYYIAERCVKSGAKVVIVGRNEDNLKKSSDILGVDYITYDVTNVQGFDAMLEKAYTLMGGLNVLINNAGISLHEQGILNVTPEGFDRQFNVNLRAPFFLSQAFIKMVELHNINKSQIIFITSERGLYCDIIPYGLTKKAICSLTEGLGHAYAKTGLRVNAIAPGVTASDMTNVDKGGNLYRQDAVSKKVFIPEEVAEVAEFLISDTSDCISGHIIPCNKGNHLRCDWF